MSFGAAQITKVLSHEQRRVVQMALAGKNLFFTGSAGTGKSFLLRELISRLKDSGRRVAVTASTGLAGLNIDGQTLHSFAGVGLGKQHAHILRRKALAEGIRDRWSKTDVLIIDEISMVEARWFDALSAIAKATRRSTQPFGGMQLILCGDFFQLPPVPDQSYVDYGIPISFAFEAVAWRETIQARIQLTQVFRQTQPELVRMLDEMRAGALSPTSIDLLYGLSRPLEYRDGIQPVELLPLRRLVDAINQAQLRKMKSNKFKFKAIDKLG